MGKMENNLCTSCPGEVIADSTHILTKCSLPQVFLHYIDDFEDTRPILNGHRYDMESLRLEFLWPSKLVSRNTKNIDKEMFLAATVLKMTAQRIHTNEHRPNTWSRIYIYVKLLSAMRLAILIAQRRKQKMGFLPDFLDYLLTNKYLIERFIQEVDGKLKVKKHNEESNV